MEQEKIGKEIGIFAWMRVKIGENNRGYFEVDNIRLVLDFDTQQIIGWYRP